MNAKFLRSCGLAALLALSAVAEPVPVKAPLAAPAAKAADRITSNDDEPVKKAAPAPIKPAAAPPLVEQKPAAPSPSAKPLDPVQLKTAEKPAAKPAPAASQITESSGSAKPVAAPAPAKVTEVPAARPVTAAPAPAKVTEVPAAKPITATPAPAKVTEVPAAKPITATPAPAKVTEVPAAKPVTATPAPAKVTEVPAVKPVTAAPTKNTEMPAARRVTATPAKVTEVPTAKPLTATPPKAAGAATPLLTENLVFPQAKTELKRLMIGNQAGIVKVLGPNREGVSYTRGIDDKTIARFSDDACGSIFCALGISHDKLNKVAQEIMINYSTLPRKEAVAFLGAIAASPHLDTDTDGKAETFLVQVMETDKDVHARRQAVLALAVKHNVSSSTTDHVLGLYEHSENLWETFPVQQYFEYHAGQVKRLANFGQLRERIANVRSLYTPAILEALDGSKPVTIAP